MDDHLFQRKKVGSIIQLKFFELLIELTTFLLTNIKLKKASSTFIVGKVFQ